MFQTGSYSERKIAIIKTVNNELKTSRKWNTSDINALTISSSTY